MVEIGTDRAASERRGIGWWVGYALVLGSTALFLIHVWSIPQRIDLHIYYSAVRSSPPGKLYEYGFTDRGYGFIYPTFAAVLMWPLTRLRYQLVEQLWLIASVLSSVAFVWFGARRLPRAPRWSGYVPVVVASAIWVSPILQNALFGQINAFLALAVLVDFYAIVTGKRWGGVLIGVATAVKLTPAIALLPLLSRKYVPAIGRTAMAFVACSLFALVVMPSNSVRYWTSGIFDTDRVVHVDSPVNNSLWRVLAAGNIGGRPATVLFLVAALILVVVAFVRSRVAMQRGNYLAALVIAMCCGYAISPITWSHHLFFVVFCPLLIAGDWRRPWRIALGALAALVIIELSNPGQGHFIVNVRALLLPLAVIALPIDRPQGDVPAVAPLGDARG